jgi:hypothetical protein
MVRHAITGGAAGAALSFVLNDYAVILGGPNISLTASIMGQRIYGSYQGLSGIAMGTLATLPNSGAVTAAAPSNTALTANLPTGLGGQGAVTAAVAAATDGIWGSYQVQPGSATVQGRRLVIRDDSNDDQVPARIRSHVCISCYNRSYDSQSPATRGAWIHDVAGRRCNRRWSARRAD